MQGVSIYLIFPFDYVAAGLRVQINQFQAKIIQSQHRRID
jgi:hypothetical protein